MLWPPQRRTWLLPPELIARDSTSEAEPGGLDWMNSACRVRRRKSLAMSLRTHFLIRPQLGRSCAPATASSGVLTRPARSLRTAHQRGRWSAGPVLPLHDLAGSVVSPARRDLRATRGLPAGHYLYSPMADRLKFFRWVACRRAYNNPRGDFIRDTRRCLERGLGCESEINRGGSEAQREYRRLLRQWERLGRARRVIWRGLATQARLPARGRRLDLLGLGDTTVGGFRKRR